MESVIKVPIKVQAINSASFDIEIPEEDKLTSTIAELKFRINDKLYKDKLVIDKMYLDHYGEVNENKTVYYYNILWPFYITVKDINSKQTKNESKIIDKKKQRHLEAHRFVNPDSVPVPLKSSKDAPDYRGYLLGLNLFGICKCAGCIAKDEEVIYPVGMKPFNLITDKSEVKCPKCGTYFEPTTCGFAGCVYKFIGKKAEEGKKTENVNTGYKIAKKTDEVDYYDPTNGMTNWASLFIIVQKIPDTKEALDALMKEYKCFWCREPIVTSNFLAFKCNHIFCLKCFNEHFHDNEDKSKCPICKADRK